MKNFLCDCAFSCTKASIVPVEILLRYDISPYLDKLNNRVTFIGLNFELDELLRCCKQHSEESGHAGKVDL